MSACEVQAAIVGAVGQLMTIGVAGGTVKVEAQLFEPQASVTVYVKLSEAPAQLASAGSAGMAAVLAVAEHPPVNEKPAFQAL